VTLAANAAANIPALGALVKIYSAPYGAVRVKMDGGEAFTLLEGQGVRLPGGKQFRDVQIQNTAATSQTILVFIGSSSLEDSRITGTVSVIDGALARTKANQGFTLATQLAAVAGQGGYIGLYNPTTTKNAVIDQMLVNGICGATDFIVGFMASGTNGLVFFNNPPSKLATGIASTMECRTLNQVATISGSSLFVCPANTPNAITWRPPEPIVVPPGYLFFLRFATNTAGIATIDYYEQTI
jgi:hypothetical protein